MSSTVEGSYLNHLDALLQLEPAVSVILESVRATVGDKHSHTFGKDVLNNTIDFLYELLLDSLSVSTSVVSQQENSNLQQATGKMFDHMY